MVPKLRTNLLAAVAATAADAATATAADAATTAMAIKDDKIRGLVPAEYHEFLLLFKKAIADVLPPH